jgi:general secretion pathway protein G
MAAPAKRSASCRKAEGRGGFTLVEVMVVLALMAALLAIAFPQVVRLYTRARLAFERKDLEHQLSELPERVRAAGQAGILADPSASGAAMRAADAAAFEDPRPLHLSLPAGWRVSVPKPVLYHYTGACDGGEVVFSLPPLSLRYVLTPPLCRPRLADAR